MSEHRDGDWLCETCEVWSRRDRDRCYDCGWKRSPDGHTRTVTAGLTEAWIDYCAQCSDKAQEWVGWPCPALAAPSPGEPS